MRRISFIFLCILCIVTSEAQNVFPKTGNVGIGTKQPAATLQVIGNTRLGGKTGYVSIDSNGTFSFAGSASYKVGADKYVFQYINNANLGLFFNSTSSQYEFRNGAAAPVFYVNTNTGSTHIAANLYIDSSLYLQGTKFISISDTGNLFIGSNAGVHNGASNNTTLGYNTLFTNTTGYVNTATGANALYSNTSGRANTATGAFALYTNATSEANTATGAYALYNNQSGDGNTVTGTNAMYLNVNGWHNTSTGVSSMYSNISGAFQSAHGFEALYNNTSGAFNTATAYHALYGNTTGNYNVAVGVRALDKNVTGSNNTALGSDADASSINLSNATVIGYNAVVNASNKVVIGNSAVTVIGGQVGWSTLSDGRFKKNIKADVPGLAFVNKLKPVTYTFDAIGFEKFLGKDEFASSQIADLSAASRTVRTGFIAQEVEKAAQEVQYDFDGVHKPQNEKDNYSLVYSELVPSLVKSVQELSKENEELKQRLSHIESQLDASSASKTAGLVIANTALNETAFFTDQNTPNPCYKTTLISYCIPSATVTANLLIVSSGGISVYQQKLIPGKGNITVDVSHLSAGVYTYFMIADGNVSKGRQLIVMR